MSFLDQLTDHQRRTVVRLPYRVGLWVSRSDETGGAEADARELQALSNLIHGFAEDVFGAEAIQFIISETIMLKDQWNSWGDDLESLPDECRVALDVLEDYMDEKEMRAFKGQMFDIAEAVALAFTEHEHVGGFWPRLRLLWSYRLDRYKARKAGTRVRSFHEYRSISSAERRVLDQLAAALDLH